MSPSHLLRRVRARRRRLVRVERLDRWTARPTGRRPRDPPAGLGIRLAGPDDADALTPLLEGGEPTASRFARGDVALIAELDGKPDGCVWLLEGPRRMPDYLMRIEPRPEASCMYGGYVAPEARRNGLGEALFAATRDLAFQHGTTVVGYVDPGNRQSVAILRRLGWEHQEGVALVILLDRLSLRLPRARLSRRLGRRS